MKNIKKVSLLLIVIALAGSEAFCQNVRIPDAIFKKYLTDHVDGEGNADIDTNADREIQIAEAAAFTGKIEVEGEDGKKIKELTGIEAFVNITYLDCSGNELKALDVSKNTELTYLRCISNELPTLDVSQNVKLTTLLCEDNKLTRLDVSKNTELSELDCSLNSLNALDVSTNTALTELYCEDNKLASLDVSNNKKLTELLCFTNQLKELDVSQNTALTDLDCSSNKLTSLDVSTNTALTELYCEDNKLASLDVSNNKKLTELLCFTNQLKELDVSQNTALTALSCGDNPLAGLDVGENIALTDLDCSSNKLTSLDVSKNTELTYLRCISNELPTLDVSQNTALTELFCHSNELKALNLRNGNNNNLTKFSVANNDHLVCVQVDAAADFRAKWQETFTDAGINTNIISEDCIVSVTGITVSGTGGESTITTAGGNLQMTATITPPDATNQKVIWSVDDTDVATINAAGLLTAVSNGTVTVKATAQDASGTTGTKRITITGYPVPVTGITVSGTGGESTITTAGGNLQMTATITPSNATNQKVIWSVDDTDVATINAAGLLTAVSNGRVTVTATAQDASGTTGTKRITITGYPVPVTGITVDGASGASTITTAGGTLEMKETITPTNATNQEVTWSVDDTDVATINAAGLLTAVSNGTVTVKATAQDASGTTGTKRITISNQRSAVVTSIADDRIESHLILYPNPTGDMLTIATSELVIEPMIVTDLAGNTVRVLAKDDRHVDLSLLQAGAYLLQVKTHSGSRFSRFVKQ